MKNIPYLLVLFCIVTGSGQPLREFSVPTGYHKLLEVAGDLDKDGVREKVLLYDTNNAKEPQDFKRELYICKVEKGKMRLWKSNATVVWSAKAYGFYNDSLPWIEIKNNVLIIEQKFQSNARHQTVYRNLFRFQNQDWYLIGATSIDSDNCLWSFTYDINFSTRQVAISKEYDSCEDDVPAPQKDENYLFKYPFKEVPKMDGFVPGETQVELKEEAKRFYY